MVLKLREILSLWVKEICIQTVKIPEDSLDSLDSFEVDEFKSGLSDYEFVVLSKRDLSQFLRCVEPLTKTTVDCVCKSVQIALY